MANLIEPTGTVEGDKAAVIAAALAAKNAGEETVYLADGNWLLDYLTPTDIHDRYLVMEHGTFSINSWVYPFKPDEWVRRTRTTPNTGGRGRIAIELDDTTANHWRYVFPVAKRLGVPITVAWHMEDSTSGWVHEAYRHGWGIMSHLPGNYRATEMLANGTLDNLAQQSLDAIHGIIGDDLPVGFVYPQHIRSAETDEVLKKYYTWGRGRNTPTLYRKDMPNPWLVSSTSLDTYFMEDGITSDLKRLMREIAKNDSQLSCYFHVAYSNYERQQRCLEEFVRYGQALGIEFVTSDQLYADNNLIEDPYLSGDAWSITRSPAAGFTTDESYHGGRSALMASPPDARGHPQLATSQQAHIPTKPGFFTKLRVSYRIKNDDPATFSSSTQGVMLSGIMSFREFMGGRVQESSYLSLTGNVVPAGTIPSGDWVEYTQDIYVQPTVETIRFSLLAQNLNAGNSFHVGEFRVTNMGWVREYTTTATLTGTTNVLVRLPMGKFDMCKMQVVPGKVMRGDLSVEVVGGTGLRIRSTSAADTMPIRITVEPRQDYYIDE